MSYCWYNMLELISLEFTVTHLVYEVYTQKKAFKEYSIVNSKTNAWIVQAFHYYLGFISVFPTTVIMTPARAHKGSLVHVLLATRLTSPRQPDHCLFFEIFIKH